MMNPEAKAELFALLDHEENGSDWIIKALKLNVFNGNDVTACAYGTIAYHDNPSPDWDDNENWPEYEGLRQIIYPGISNWNLTPLERAVEDIHPKAIERGYEDALYARDNLVAAIHEWQETQREKTL